MEITKLAKKDDLDLTTFGFPSVDVNWNYDEDSFDYTPESNPDTLTVAQRNIFNAIVESNGGMFMIDAPGGCGKTYLLKQLVLHYGYKNVVVTPTGLAALNFRYGMTAHSFFHLPLDNVNAENASFTKLDKNYAALERAQLIIWDEIFASKEGHVDCVYNLCSFHFRTSEVFWGKKIVFSGDFRQTLPIIPGAYKTQIIRSTIKYCNFWRYVTKFALHENLRAGPENQVFAEFLLQVGNGTLSRDDIHIVTLPNEVQRADTPTDMFFKIYGNEMDPGEGTKCILCPTNELVKRVNQRCSRLYKRDDETVSYRTYYAFDTAVEDDLSQRVIVSRDMMNQSWYPGFPEYNLTLKVGVPIMCIRNLSRSTGLMNGTRLIVTKLGRNFVCGRIITEGAFKNNEVVIPRISILSNEGHLSFKMKRTQLPIVVCWAMTINKSQCQSFEKVGLYLTKDCQTFSHGQLYVALSRVSTGFKGIMVFNRKVRNEVWNIALR